MNPANIEKKETITKNPKRSILNDISGSQDFSEKKVKFQKTVLVSEIESSSDEDDLIEIDSDSESEIETKSLKKDFIDYKKKESRTSTKTTVRQFF